jgi:hypothetical protein
MEENQNKSVGFGAGAPLPPISTPTLVPAQIITDLQLLTSIGEYINSLKAGVQNLPDNVAALTSALTGSTDPVVTDALTSITNAYNAVFGNATLGTPDVMAGNQHYAVQDLTNFANSSVASLNMNRVALSTLQNQVAILQGQVTAQQATIVQLEAGSGTAGGGGGGGGSIPPVGVPPKPPAKPATNPNQMSTTTFLVGVASVLAIGGGVWWVARNAKAKAKEAHAAGAFKPKPAAIAAAANPKRLTAGSKR